MGTEVVESPFPSPDESEISRAINQLDATRDAFFEAVARFVKLPSEANSDEMDLETFEFVNGFRCATACVLGDDEMEPQDAANMLIGLYSQEDKTRVRLLTAFGFAVGTFSEVEESEYDKLRKEIIQRLEENWERGFILDEVMEGFTDDIELDMARLRKAVISSNRAKLIKVASYVGKGSLDIAKVTAGVIIGVSILKRIQRPKE